MYASERSIEWNNRVFERLTSLSVRDDYTPFGLFDWPDHLPDEEWWMSPELLSVHDTPLMEQVDEATLKRLSKWESINFYSLNVHGIRELLIEVVRRIHSLGFEEPSEFFHRFIGEENDHMWFFAQFCRRYGGKIYPNRMIPLGSEANDSQLESFLVFARILIFEELVDHFNRRMGKDERLHPLIQNMNWVHHVDESRHIAGGREIVRQLHRDLRPLKADRLRAMSDYLRRYMAAVLEALYNPRAYRDAGMPGPHQVRRDLLGAPGRVRHHRAFIAKITQFLLANDILMEEASA